MEKKSMNLKSVISNVIKDARINSKNSECLICGNPLTKTCSSHTIPKMVLSSCQRSQLLSKITSRLTIHLIYKKQTWNCRSRYI
ncbi:MAG: hypothetical protein K9L64_06885 [Candidatus Izimaplasma sp.]|nr:hypothetical protein [Candidatus Izimaplasma bacterium]